MQVDMERFEGVVEGVLSDLHNQPGLIKSSF